jgi:mannose-6-phosphate isomerase-like protein (cupin superfamily)
MNKTERGKTISCHRALTVLFALVVGATCSPLTAQTKAKPPVKTPSSGGNSFDGPGDVRYRPERDMPTRKIDMFIGDWRDSLPRHILGSLVLRDILTHGDNFAPPQPGALLQAANFLAYGRLAPGNSTVPSKLDHEQHIFYVVGGTGEIIAGPKRATLHKDVAAFVPENLEFEMKNTGDTELTMYVISEPAPEGFVPAKEVLVTNEREVPVRVPMVASPFTLQGASGHWAHVVRDLFSKTDGLATIGDVITVTIDPMTMGEPHPHNPGQEEIWVAIDGTSLAFISTQLRVQRPGMAYMIRPDQTMTHSNINAGDTPAKFLWFSGSSLKK